jgi:hypothetical protein
MAAYAVGIFMGALIDAWLGVKVLLKP